MLLVLFKVSSYRLCCSSGAVGRSLTSWSDDLVKITETRMRMAQDRSVKRTLGEAYVQHWTSFS